jgi:hypothetical protein
LVWIWIFKLIFKKDLDLKSPKKLIWFDFSLSPIQIQFKSIWIFEFGTQNLRLNSKGVSLFSSSIRPTPPFSLRLFYLELAQVPMAFDLVQLSCLGLPPPAPSHTAAFSATIASCATASPPSPRTSRWIKASPDRLPFPLVNSVPHHLPFE